MPLSRLDCVRCDRSHEPGKQRQLCDCGSALLARYDLERAAKEMRPGHLALRSPTLWRYREALPVEDPDDCVSLGEGFTPLLPIPRLSASVGLPRILVKDDGSNPSGSGEARGFALVVSMARALGFERLCAACNGDAAAALTAYAARAGLRAHVFLPADVASSQAAELAARGAQVTAVQGPIGEAGRLSANLARDGGYLDCGPLRETYRLEGAKTLGYELAEQLGWSLPDALLYPTASGMGIAGLWKAFEELEAMGFVGPKRPRIYAVQAEGCAPIARAFETGDERAAAWPEIRTRYARFRVAETVVDSLVLRALRASHGAAVAVSDAEILQGVKRAAADEGMLLSPGGGACVAALQRLKASGHLSPHDSILLVDTAAAFRHTDLLAALL